MSFSSPVFAEEKWIIERSGDELMMKPKYNYDYDRRYKGEIESDGSVRMRNPYSGETLRGYVDKDGYGKLRGSEGNVWKIRP